MIDGEGAVRKHFRLGTHVASEVGSPINARGIYKYSTYLKRCSNCGTFLGPRLSLPEVIYSSEDAA